MKINWRRIGCLYKGHSWEYMGRDHNGLIVGYYFFYECMRCEKSKVTTPYPEGW